MRTLPILLLPILASAAVAQCTLVKRINQATNQGSSPAPLFAARASALLMAANDGVLGEELWTSDGTRTGTVLVKDIYPGGRSSQPFGFTECFTGRRYFTFFLANDGVHGHEPWVTDGTAAGTRRLKVVNRGTSSFPTQFGWPRASFRGRVYFAADTAATGTEIWVTDGTPSGTNLFRDLVPGSGSSLPNGLTVAGDRMFFTAHTSATGFEPWVTDGTPAGTQRLGNLAPGSSGSFPTHWTQLGNKVFFRARTPSSGYELFVTDGTRAGTSMVKDIAPGTFNGVTDAPFATLPGAVYFGGMDGSLWKSDGTTVGTVLVHAGRSGSKLGELMTSEGQLFFSRELADRSVQLWVSDGTRGGTREIPMQLAPRGLSEFVSAGGGIYFIAYPSRIFFTDGTMVGTVPACPSSPYQRPQHLTKCDGEIYFSAETPTLGWELHRLGRGSALTEHVGHPCGSSAPTLTASNPVLGATTAIQGTGPGSSGFLVLGIPAPPLHLPGLAAPGCGVWLDLATITLAPVPQTTNWSVSVRVANSAALQGSQVMLQTAMAPAPLSLSNGVQLTLGR